MPKIPYKSWRPSQAALNTVVLANKIIGEYKRQGLDLTLRQLYYQFVSRGHCANSDREYKRLSKMVDRGRLAGLIDWDAIEDRLRETQTNSHWKKPSEIVWLAQRIWRIDLWARQPKRVEVWIEKDALLGVIEGVCTDHDVPYLACRGYNSQSAMWRSAVKFASYAKKGQRTTILYLGDHDPSGLDMTRDIYERINLLSFNANVKVDRLALNMNQIRQYNPPPNPAKMKDARAQKYVITYGHSSWELDALDPKVIIKLVKDAILRNRDDKIWKEDVKRQEEGREKLEDVATNFEMEEDDSGEYDEDDSGEYDEDDSGEYDEDEEDTDDVDEEEDDES